MSILTPRDVPLGGLRAMTVRRTLPNRHRTTIGAWCFVDHFGPDLVEHSGGMHVAPHPHTGLQTVTWLFEGEVEHHDSVGSRQLVSPGQVNLMTAGAGISHSEVSTSTTSRLHGVQLWVALPDDHRFIAPFFEHHVSPRMTIGPAQFTVFVGSLTGDGVAATSTATTFTGLVAAEILIPENTTITIPVDHSYEHGFLIDSGELTVNDEQALKDELAYVEPGHSSITIATGDVPSRMLMIGGEPFEEELVMWWNFIGRSHEEIVQMRQQWQSDVVEGSNPDGVFGTVAYEGPVIPAPEMPHVHLRPRKLPRP
ncbi:hypothetical protein AINA4_01350 [Aurantimicrobium sp. INA4]|uniref:pirin family protein n=1 Tax=Aurantimicrobium sp. INA4 TaxID=2986279 RepID=UPI0024906114|nr:pirin family protein [Aurantimicrobium sp. INA4]BDU10214.1 hypothetical protein AINA4_01350 [Aurantimicrobium sp. INA4]